jgi:hypothetical protein
MAEIRLEHVGKRFDDFVAVRDTSLAIANALSSSCSDRRAAARPRRCA